MADTRNTTQVPARVQHEVPDAAIAWWLTGPGQGEFRAEPLPSPAEAEATVRTLWTGVSRGTETIVARGEVPASERDRMRAPFQGGDFPFPVKYGYLNVGEVEDGPEGLRGRTVFGLLPHQSRSVVPAALLQPLPPDVPARRAVLAGAVETAVNVLWDARPMIGDHVVVMGAGMIGCAIGRLAQGMPGVAVTVVDVDPARAQTAATLGLQFATPDDPLMADVVIEASGTAAGLQHALRSAPADGEVVVASWYGSRAVPLELGADFHARRLTIRSSQVGAVAPARRAARTTAERLALALRLLADPAYDALLGGTSSWRDLPEIAAALAEGTADVLCHTIDWRDADTTPPEPKETA
jgi:hypothetical protein